MKKKEKKLFLVFLKQIFMREFIQNYQYLFLKNQVFLFGDRCLRKGTINPDLPAKNKCKYGSVFVI